MLPRTLSARPPRNPSPRTTGDDLSVRLLDLVDECVLVTDPQGRITFASQAVQRVLGYAPKELIGKDLDHLRAPGRPKGSKAAAGTPVMDRGGTTYRRKDGEWIVMTTATHVLAGPTGKGKQRVSVLRDVSSEARLREQLLQSEKMSAVGQLVSGVAHDLNNPLTSVVGYAQLLLARDSDSKVRRGLEVIAEEAERASRIVKNLLTFSRQHSPEKRYLGLNGIIEKTLELKAHDLHVHQIAVETRLDPDLPYTLLDFHQMQQVVLNLLINAEQAIRPQKPAGTIRITTRTAGGGIRIIMEDDGPGIPEGALSRVFEPFFTTKPVGLGTGLGLSICHGIVAEHGGSIRAENRREGGARFTIDLPILEPQTAQAEAGVPMPVAASPESPRRPAVATGLKNILIVDDEPTIQDLLVAMLTVEGHRVDTASSADAALKKVQTRSYDLIISDLRMPGDSGIQFYNRLRGENRSMAERVVFMTGDLVSPESLQFMRGVKNFWLPKPFTIDNLRETLKRFEDRFRPD
jgi:two-component system, NtrC family, sensor kinase